MKKDIKALLLSELNEYFDRIGERAFRARQVFRWLRSGAETFDEMTDLSISLREKLGSEFYITVPRLLEKQISQLDGTIKYLWGMRDGNAIESVVMEHSYGSTVCVSTQSGCRMGCVFCASAAGGLKRNLSASEMEDQVRYSQIDSCKKISNVVLMGIGEPLDNFDNLIRFIELIRHPDGMNIGARHITVSTCGIIDNIDKLASYDIQLTLSVSLHAPDDETRTRLMPINRSTGVAKLLDACTGYYRTTGRRVSFEYAMIDGVNDSAAHAERLADLLKNRGSHLNLLLLNNISEFDYKESSPSALRLFTKLLESKGINYTVRRRLGSDINASCGQLREKHLSG